MSVAIKTSNGIETVANVGGGSGGGSSSVIYSTTEQRIGTWIDGKPLYRIVGTFTISGDHVSDTTMAHNIPNISVITQYSMGKLTSNGSYTSTPYYLDSTWYFNANVSPTSITYRNKGMTGSYRYIFEYTKTTD